MDICFWIPLLWVLGASGLAGILGWLWGKKEASSLSSLSNSKDLEIQNLKKQIVEIRDKADNSLAGLGRESRELQEKVNVWKEKYNKLQLEKNTSNLQNGKSPESDKKLKEALAKISKLEEDKKALLFITEEKKPVAKEEAQNIDKDMISKLKKDHKEELKKLKSKLKKSKSKYKTLKKKKSEGPIKEIEFTRSIDINALKDLIEKMPLKRVSEKVIDKKSDE